MTFTCSRESAGTEPIIVLKVLDLLYHRSVGEESKINRADHPVSYHLDTLLAKTGSESMEATDFTQEADLVCGICGAHGGYEIAEVRGVQRTSGGHGLCGGSGKRRMDGMFPGRPQSFRHQRPPVDNCSPGLGGMAQNGGTRGETFHGEMDRCRGSQGWTTACSRMPERAGNDQGEDSPKQAGSCWFARPC